MAGANKLQSKHDRARRRPQKAGRRSSPNPGDEIAMYGTRAVNSSHVGLYTSIKTALVYGNSPGGISQVAGRRGEGWKTGSADEPCPGPAETDREPPRSATRQRPPIHLETLTPPRRLSFHPPPPIAGSFVEATLDRHVEWRSAGPSLPGPLEKPSLPRLFPIVGADLRMIERRYVFPGVLEMNYQSKRRLGVNIYLIDGGTEYALIDVGFLDELPDVLELIRQMNFSLSSCKMIIATHADVDHIQGLNRAREVLKCTVAAHSKSVAAIEEGDEVLTYARIDAQGIHIPIPRCKVDRVVNEGTRHPDRRQDPGSLEHARPYGRPARDPDGKPALLRRQYLPGWLRRRHRRPPWLEPPRIRRQLEAYPRVRRRIPAPLHGPIFRKDNDLIDRTMARLLSYTHMSDFGTCASTGRSWTPGKKSWREAPSTGDSMAIHHSLRVPIFSPSTIGPRCATDLGSIAIGYLIKIGDLRSDIATQQMRHGCGAKLVSCGACSCASRI